MAQWKLRCFVGERQRWRKEGQREMREKRLKKLNFGAYLDMGNRCNKILVWRIYKQRVEVVFWAFISKILENGGVYALVGDGLKV